MKETKRTAGVTVITLTATVREGALKYSQRTRIGFCGEFSKRDISLILGRFKTLYIKLLKEEHGKADKITCRATAKTTECEMILNGMG